MEIELLNPQLAKPLDKVPEKKIPNDLIVQPKYDGFRLLNSPDGVFYTRNLKDKSEKCTFLLDEICKIRSLLDKILCRPYILDGEILAVDKDTNSYLPIRNLNSLFNSKALFKLEDLDFNLKYVVFDIIGTDLNQKSRIEFLNTVFNSIDDLEDFEFVELAGNEFIEGYDIAMLKAVANEYITQGYEGAIFRNPDSLFMANARNNDLIKQKASTRPEITAILSGANLGEGLFGEVFSKFTWSVFSNESQDFYEISNATTGLNHNEIRELDSLIRESMTLTDELPLVFADIMYDAISITDKGLSLRFPVIKQLRYDLNENDASILEDLN